MSPGERRGITAREMRTICAPDNPSWYLAPLAWVYGGLMRVRNARYDRGVGVCRAAMPVISVGNITVGGTGKTPMVIEFVRRLAALGRRAAILTRGYAARVGQTADEVLEFQEAVPQAPVVVDPDRVTGAARAAREHGADCLVLDDGFQHRRLARDADIVLIDALNPWGGGRVLPAGRLREPRDGLRRADLVIVTRANQTRPEIVRAIRADLERLAPDVPVATAGVVAEQLVDRHGGRHDVAELAHGDFFAVCGVGNPHSFLELLRGLGRAFDWALFADHHHYNFADVDDIRGQARAASAVWVVTTRKDWVKLRVLWPDDRPALLRLDVRITWLDGESLVDATLRRALERGP